LEKTKFVNKIAHFKSIFNEKGHNGNQNQEFWIAKNQKKAEIDPEIPSIGSGHVLALRGGTPPPPALRGGGRELEQKSHQKPPLLLASMLPSGEQSRQSCESIVAHVTTVFRSD